MESCHTDQIDGFKMLFTLYMQELFSTLYVQFTTFKIAKINGSAGTLKQIVLYFFFNMLECGPLQREATGT